MCCSRSPPERYIRDDADVVCCPPLIRVAKQCKPVVLELLFPISLYAKPYWSTLLIGHF